MLFEAPARTEIDHVVMSQDRSAVLGVATSDAPSRVHWLDPDMAEIQAAFDKSVAKQGVTVEISSLSADRSAMLVTLARPDSPGALYYFSVANGTMQRIAGVQRPAQAGAGLAGKDRALQGARRPGDRSSDDRAQGARGTRPTRGDAAPRRPWAQDVASWDYLAQYIASRGYLVIQPNFRGSTGYGTAFRRKGEGQMGLAMQDDISDGLAWAAAQGLADPNAPASSVRRMAAMPRCGGWPRIRGSIGAASRFPAWPACGAK
jgi:hypothetical protein